ncbi:hypothetical protein KSP40_PGU010328 [Platanthera guangdongensis]|uniref:Ubiquitin-like protease family profile domain-containing protein n=1 Tax=Platanthera guangdongensis TaxID=2320717 RepID=A0ABR2LXK4_9ASPA
MATLDTTPPSTLEVTLVDLTPPSSPNSLIKNVKQRANRKRKVPGTSKKKNSDKCRVLPGNQTIFDIENLLMNRALIDDLLGEQWLLDVHINTWALVLSAQRRRSPTQFKSFLYISPDHTYFKRSKCFNSEAMISHVTPKNVRKTNILLMPVHTPHHWSLRVCDMKPRKWDFYDSMPRSAHKASLTTLVTNLAMVCRAFGEAPSRLGPFMGMVRAGCAADHFLLQALTFLCVVPPSLIIIAALRLIPEFGAKGLGI